VFPDVPGDKPTIEVYPATRAGADDQADGSALVPIARRLRSTLSLSLAN
jgi:hypothetical protein